MADTLETEPFSFLIQRGDAVDDEFTDFSMLSSSRYPEILRPNSFPSHPIKGWGNHRIEVPGCEISFCEEPVGLQVDFEEGTMTESVAQQIVAEIAVNITRETGHAAEVFQC